MESCVLGAPPEPGLSELWIHPKFRPSGLSGKNCQYQERALISTSPTQSLPINPTSRSYLTPNKRMQLSRLDAGDVSGSWVTASCLGRKGWTLASCR